MRLIPGFLAFGILLALSGACSQEPDGFTDRNLEDYGLALTLLLPDSALVLVKDYGPMRDFTIQDEAGFSMQIFEFQAPTGDTAGEKQRQLNMARQVPFFKEVVREDEHGFIFSKQPDSAAVEYDFRFIRMLGERELIFQAGLVGGFSLEAVERMYASAKGAVANE